MSQTRFLGRTPTGCPFSVIEVVKVLSPRGTPSFPIKGIWYHCVSTKATFFAWEATWDKILTLDKLQRRGLHLLNRCYLCGRDEEFTHHILLHCLVVSYLWVLFLSLVCLLGLPQNGQGGSPQLEGFFCLKKKKKHVEIGSTMHLLDSVDGA